jgi:hypothetical protein
VLILIPIHLDGHVASLARILSDVTLPKLPFRMEE